MTMRRRTRGLLVLLILSILVVPQASQAPLGHIPVIGVLMPTSAEVAAPALHAFQQALITLGYREGETLVFESRFADGAYERLPALVAELVRLEVDVLLAGSPAMIRAATQATTTIPIVGVGVRTGLFARFTRQAANLTGVGTGGEEVYRRAQSLLQAVVPGVSRVAILWDAHNPITGQTWLTLAARLTGVRLHLVEVRGPQDFERAVAAARTEQADALIVPASGLFAMGATRIAALAEQSRLPTLGPIREFAEAGCLMTYGPNTAEMFRRAAVYVDKILKGAKPADLPVEPPPRFELAINLKTAQALGLTIPPTLRAQADALIQ
jgi:putative tryptophan/tyrosine transport system substrate-binding protein